MKKYHTLGEILAFIRHMEKKGFAMRFNKDGSFFGVKKAKG